MTLVSSNNRQAIDALKNGYDRLNFFYKLFFPSAMKRFLNHYQPPAQPGRMTLTDNQFEDLNRLYRSFLRTGRFRRWLFSSLTAFSNTAAASSLGQWISPQSDGLGVEHLVTGQSVSRNFRAVMKSENPHRLTGLLQSMRTLRSEPRTWMNSHFTPMKDLSSDVIRSVCIRLAEINGLTERSYKKEEGNKVLALYRCFNFIKRERDLTEPEKSEFYALAANHRSPEDFFECIGQLQDNRLFTADNFRYCMTGAFPLLRRSALTKLHEDKLDTPEIRQACAASQNPHFMADCLLLLNWANVLDAETLALCSQVPNDTSLCWFYEILSLFPAETLTRERVRWFVSYAKHGEALLRDTCGLWRTLVDKHTEIEPLNRDIDQLMFEISSVAKNSISTASVHQCFKNAGQNKDLAQSSTATEFDSSEDKAFSCQL